MGWRYREATQGACLCEGAAYNPGSMNTLPVSCTALLDIEFTGKSNFFGRSI